MATDDRPWLIDGRSGAVMTYGELIAVLSVRPARVRLRFLPASTRETLIEVTAAIAHEIELTLFDSDFGVQEVGNLGYAFGDLNQPTMLSSVGPVESARLVELAAGASRGRLGLFTSGSTGLPKLVWQGFANLARAVRMSPRHKKAVWALAYNPTHVAGIQVYLQALANLCPVVDVYGLDRVRVLAALERHGVTHVSATPSFYRLLLPFQRALPGVRSVTLGGEPADAALLAKLAALFPNARFHNVYASTEAGTLLVAEDDVFRIPEALDDRIKLHDDRLWVHRSLLGEFGEEQKAESGKAVPSRETVTQLGGEVETNRDAVSGETVKRSDSVTGPQSHGITAAEAAAWYDTGDVVEVISNDPLQFRIVARERDWVNVGGNKVNPREVESAITEHSAIREAKAYGRKNSVLGSILCADVVVGAGSMLDEPELRSWLAARLQPHKIPRMIRFVDKLAVTRTGKLLRS